MPDPLSLHSLVRFMATVLDLFLSQPPMALFGPFPWHLARPLSLRSETQIPQNSKSIWQQVAVLIPPDFNPNSSKLKTESPNFLPKSPLIMSMNGSRRKAPASSSAMTGSDFVGGALSPASTPQMPLPPQALPWESDAPQSPNLSSPPEHIGEVLNRVKKEHLQRAYKIADWEDDNDFLMQLCKSSGMLLRDREMPQVSYPEISD